MVDEKAVNTADSVIDELDRRKGFDNFWNRIDKDIQDDIRNSIAEIIDEEYSN